MVEKKFEFKVLDIRRTAKVTEGGKRMKVRAVVVAGDLNGRVGIGIEKGEDIADAVMKARKAAEKNSIEVPIIEGTIPFVIKEKFKTTEVLLKPARKGKGLVAGGSVRAVLALAGYSDISAKILKATKNSLVNTLATFKALEKLKKIYEKKLKNDSGSSN